jgi:hypothetical protein
MLREAPVNFTHDHGTFHQRYFEPEDYDIFVVAVRDPISRAISAFNWRHPFGGGPVGDGLSAEEMELYACFPELPGGVNHFAESLDDNSTCGEAARRCLHSPSARCNHLSWSFQFYLSTGLRDRTGDLLGHLRSRKDKVVFMVGLGSGAEGLSGEFSALWDWLCVPEGMRAAELETNSDYPRHHDTSLSPRGRELLKKHLVEDYFALEELRKYAIHE